MNSFFPRPRLPVIPEEILRRYLVANLKDTRFASSARLLQSIWRERQGYAAGSFIDDAGEVRVLGSLLSETSSRQGSNFLSREIARFVRRDTAYREIGALVDERRLWTNLLSSHPLTYNLFAPLKLNLALATAFFRSLLPDFVVEVLDIAFEHSPARGDPIFTGDRTAFDVVAVVRTQRKLIGFAAIEVKYSEAPLPQGWRPRSGRLDEISASSGLYRDCGAPELRRGQERQFWREHLLGCSMVERGLYEEGRFLVIHPVLNVEVGQAVASYRSHLVDPLGSRVGFDSRSLEDCIQILTDVGAKEYAAKLTDRYLNFAQVEDLIFDEADTLPPAPEIGRP